MRESKYQADLIKRLKYIFEGCIVLKNDPELHQGIPDLIILYENWWAALEVKASEYAPERPNQRYYVEQMNDMSFGAFIYPEIEDEVLSALQQTFGFGR